MTVIDPVTARMEPTILKALEERRLRLSSLPPSRQTPAIALAAVRSDPMALMYVRQEFRTNEVVLEAVRREPALWRFTTESEQTETVAIAAVKGDPFLLRLVTHQTAAIVQAAFMNPTDGKVAALRYTRDRRLLGPLLRRLCGAPRDLLGPFTRIAEQL
jgi:hypothetical protein